MSSKVKWGDRRDAKRVKAPGLQTVMTALMPNRTDAEVFLQDKVDATALVRYLEKKNEGRTDDRVKFFHCVITILARMLVERPAMNRFVQGYRVYERNEISLAFTAKRRFGDEAEESLMFFVPEMTDTVDDVSRKILGDVREMRKSEHSTGGVDALLDRFAAMPRLVMAGSAKVIRWLDFWGKNPKFITEGDPNYASILVANLGSIKSPSIYHHLNNYGSTSIVLTIGTLHKEEMVMEDGHKEIRDVVDIGATVDERIGDGFYFIRSLKLAKYICAHPELLDVPLNVPSGFDYK